MSARKTVAFTKTLKKERKNLWTERKRATTGDRGGVCWCCIKCDAEVFEPPRGQVFGPSVFLLLLLSPSQTTKAPLRRALPFFFSPSWKRQTQSFLYYAATVQSWESQAVVSVHLCHPHAVPSSSFVIIQLPRSRLPPESSDPFQHCWAECRTLCWIFT